MAIQSWIALSLLFCLLINCRTTEAKCIPGLYFELNSELKKPVVVDENTLKMRQIKEANLPEACCNPTTAYIKTNGQHLDVGACKGKHSIPVEIPPVAGDERDSIYSHTLGFCMIFCYRNYMEWTAGFISENNNKCLSASTTFGPDEAAYACHLKTESSTDTDGICEKESGEGGSLGSILLELEPACRIYDVDNEYAAVCDSSQHQQCSVKDTLFSGTIYFRCSNPTHKPIIDESFVQTPIQDDDEEDGNEDRRKRRQTEDDGLINCTEEHLHDIINLYMGYFVQSAKEVFPSFLILSLPEVPKEDKLQMETMFKTLCGEAWYQKYITQQSTISLYFHCAVPERIVNPPACETRAQALTLYFLKT